MNFELRAYSKWLVLAAVLLVTAMPSEALARDAAFIDPGLSASGATDGALKVEPKADIDAGETVLNVAKRLTLFFVNQTNQPVKIEKITLNADGNVTAEIANDDCTKQGTIAGLSRCSVEISVTPTSPGPWGVDALLTHNGAGRIVRAKLTGKTSGSTAAGEKKETGLALSTKEVAPVNFGDVEVGTGKAVRSALMVNDSPEPITIYSIDVIEADKDLQRLDQGCAVDMELKPGESCPVTLVWTPSDRSQISTDLIIRHSGHLGFAVIPIRGNAKGGAMASGKDIGSKTTITGDKSTSIPLPPSAQDLEKAAKIAPVPDSMLNTPQPAMSQATSSGGALRLIGTVGNRGVFLTGDGTTSVNGVGETFESDGRKVKIVGISAKKAEVTVDGKGKTLLLGAAPELTSKAPTRTTSSSDTSSSVGVNPLVQPASVGIPATGVTTAPPAGGSIAPLVAPTPAKSSTGASP